VRKLVAIALVLPVVGLTASGCGDDDETTTAPITPTGATGATGASGASGATGAAGAISQIEQSLEEAGLTVKQGDPASRTITLPTGEVEAEEKLDISGGELSSTSFVSKFADEADAEAVFDQYESEGILASERRGTVVYSAPTEDDVKILTDAAAG
jgi:hypothetical protein